MAEVTWYGVAVAILMGAVLSALSYRGKWLRERDARCGAQLHLSTAVDREAGMLRECTRLTCELEQTRQTLKRVTAEPAKQPGPVKARTSAEARKIVEQVNTEELYGDGRTGEAVLRK